MADQSIIDALQQQADGYRALVRLGEAQRAHVQSNRNDALLDVLHQRQAVLDRILAAEQVIAPGRKDWSVVAATLTGEQRATAERLLGETRELLERITAGDRDDVVALQQRRLNLGRQIDRTAAAKAVNRQYAAAAYAAPRPTVDLSR